MQNKFAQSNDYSQQLPGDQKMSVGTQNAASQQDNKDQWYTPKPNRIQANQNLTHDKTQMTRPQTDHHFGDQQSASILPQNINAQNSSSQRELESLSSALGPKWHDHSQNKLVQTRPSASRESKAVTIAPEVQAQMLRKSQKNNQASSSGVARRTKKQRRQNPGIIKNTLAVQTAKPPVPQQQQQAEPQVQVRAPSRTGRSQRSKQIFDLLRQVEALQGQMQKLPEAKGRHYVNPYIKIGQASNLNLNPQSAELAQQLAEQERISKLQIQRQAQLLLQQFEEQKRLEGIVSAEADVLSDKQCTCNSNATMSPKEQVNSNYGFEENELVNGQQQNEADPITQTNPVNSHQISSAINQPNSQHSESSKHLQCEDCGHVCVTATEQTSDIQQNQMSLELESEENRRKYFSPLNQMGRQDKADDASTDAAMTVAANPEDPHISSICHLRKGPTRTLVVKCVNCGSQNNLIKKLLDGENVRVQMQATKSGSQERDLPQTSQSGQRRLQPIASERYADKNQKPKQTRGVFDYGMRPSPMGLRTQKMSSNNIGNAEQIGGVLSGEAHYGPLVGDRIGAASVQFMLSKDGSNSHEDFGQINLKISNQIDGVFVNPEHAHSQSKFQRPSSKQRNDSQNRSRSRSQNRSKSRKSMKVGDGNIICGKCVQQQAPPKRPKRKMRLSSAKPTSPRGMIETAVDGDKDYCPVHGHRNEAISEVEATHRINRDYEENVTAIIKCQLSDCEHSDQATTEVVSDVISKKIHDSVEYTSLTHTARHRDYRLDEMDQQMQEDLSEALMSELRAIANGHFELGSEPIQISTQMSIDTQAKSNRINLLSLGAYTVKEDCEFELSAQSNIATNEMNSHHQSSLIVHSEMGSQQAKSGTRAEANAKASGAYGSEIAYSNQWKNQQGGYPLNQMLVNEVDDEEEFEESFEEEMEEELTIEQKSQATMPDFPDQVKEEDLVSHNTSYSDFYVIDEKEEQRLKQIAFEKFMAEKAIEAKMEKRQQGLRQKRLEQKQRAKERKERGEEGQTDASALNSLASDDARSHAVPIVAGQLPEEISEASRVILPPPEPVERDAERINLMEEGTSYEVVDRSCQYSRQTEAENQSKELLERDQEGLHTGNEEQDEEREQESQELVQLQQQDQPDTAREQGSEDNARESQDKQVTSYRDADNQESEFIDGRSDVQSYQTGLHTVKAFRHQVLYEEATQINDAASNITRLQPEQTDAKIFMQQDEGQGNQILSSEQEETDVQNPAKVKFSEEETLSRPSGSVFPTKSVKSHKVEDKFVTYGTIQENANAKTRQGINTGQASFDHNRNGSEPGSMKAEQASHTEIRQDAYHDKKHLIKSEDQINQLHGTDSNQDDTILANKDENTAGSLRLSYVRAHGIEDESDVAVARNVNEDEKHESQQEHDKEQNPESQMLGTIASNEEIELTRNDLSKLVPQMNRAFSNKNADEKHVVSSPTSSNKNDVYQSQQLFTHKQLLQNHNQDGLTSNVDGAVEPAIQSSYEILNGAQSIDKQDKASLQSPNSEILATSGRKKIKTDSPVSRETRKSHRHKSPKAVMVDRSQQDSRCPSIHQDWNDCTFAGQQTGHNSSVPDQAAKIDSVAAPYRETMLSSQMQPGKAESYDQDSEVLDKPQHLFVGQQSNKDGASLGSSRARDNSNLRPGETYDLPDLDNKDILLAGGGSIQKQLELTGESNREGVSNGPPQHQNPGILSGQLGYSEDGDTFVRRMMKERGITDATDQVSEKDNKGRQPSPDDIGAHLHYETGEEQQLSHQRLGTAELLPKNKRRSKNKPTTAAHHPPHQEAQTLPVDDDPRGGYLQFANYFKKNEKNRGSNMHGSPRQQHNDSQNSLAKDNKNQFGSIREMRSPKAYKIKSQLRKGAGKSQNQASRSGVGAPSSINQAQQRRAAPHDASYFGQKGYKSIRQMSKEVKDFRQQQQQHLSNENSPQQEGVNIKISGFASTGSKKQNLYEQSPKAFTSGNLYLARGEPASMQAWNESTEHNLKTFIQQRTAKRIKQINNEVDFIKPNLFNTSSKSPFQTTEALYLQSANSATSGMQLAQQLGQNRAGSMGDARDIQNIYQTEEELKQQFILGNKASSMSGHLNFTKQNTTLQQLEAAKNMQKFLNTESKNSMTSFEHFGGIHQQPQFWTVEKKQGRISEHGSQEEVNASIQGFEQLGQSNFSAQYREFKNRDMAKSQARRHIGNLPHVQKNMLSSDLYFHGQIASDDDTAAHTLGNQSAYLEAQRRKMVTSMTKDGISLRDELNDSLPQTNNIFTRSKPNFYDQNQTTLNESGHGKQKSAQSSSIQMLQKLKQKYSTSQGKTRANTTIGAPSMNQESNVKNQRLQFYPQTVTKKQANRGTSYGNRHAKGNMIGSNLEFSLIHDNQHAPYLGTKHVKTTAYL